MRALRARGLRFERSGRGRRFALDVPDLSLEAGAVLAVLGANGAGKSTLLRLLAGLERPAAGRVERAGDGLVTMVFQRPIAFAGSVDHNVRVALRARRLPSAEIDRRVADALGHFGIAALAPRRADRLSGGELRRLALARAFALAPTVLLLDEPFDDLDVAAQESLSRDLRQAVSTTGVAVAVVTHDLRRAALVCDHVAVLVEGALRQVGPRDAVLTRPVDATVAALVGMTNLFPGTLEADGRVTIDDEHVLAAASAGLPAGPVRVGIRPEHLKVEVGRGDGEPIGKATVTSTVSDGVLTTLDLVWAGHPLRTHLVAGRGLAREIAVGDTVSLSVRAQDVHLLPEPPSAPDRDRAPQAPRQV